MWLSSLLWGCRVILHSYIVVGGHIIISNLEDSEDESYPFDKLDKHEKRIENLEKQMNQNWTEVKMELKEIKLEFQKQFRDSEIRFEKAFSDWLFRIAVFVSLPTSVICLLYG